MDVGTPIGICVGCDSGSMLVCTNVVGRKVDVPVGCCDASLNSVVGSSVG